MSRELEMLRNVTCNGDQMVVVASPYLRAILARMEAAERVVESCETGKAPWSGNHEMMYDEDALRAYRALDAAPGEARDES